jgi:hypothetical protein
VGHLARLVIAGPGVLGAQPEGGEPGGVDPARPNERGSPLPSVKPTESTCQAGLSASTRRVSVSAPRPSAVSEADPAGKVRSWIRLWTRYPSGTGGVSVYGHSVASTIGAGVRSAGTITSADGGGADFLAAVHPATSGSSRIAATAAVRPGT